MLPNMALPVLRVAARPVTDSGLVSGTASEPTSTVSRSDETAGKSTGIPKRFDWARAFAIAAVVIYVVGAVALLLRICVGLAMSLRFLRGSRATGRSAAGIEIRESSRVAAPVTLGIARPAIVLPGDWSEWPAAKLDAVLAHERSHVQRNDPGVQLLSAIHRALLWHSPLSWFLHKRIVQVAEEVSDEAAVAVSHDRAMYAEVLLHFIQRGGTTWHGVPMARYGKPVERIHRILDGTALSRGVTRWSMAAILAFGSPLAYVVATAHPQSAPKVRGIVQTAPQGPPAVEALAIHPSVRNPREVLLQVRPAPPQGAAVILIFDKSSSMEGRKLQMARLAASSVVEDLRPIDTVGVLTFDNVLSWAVEPRLADDRAMINEQIANIRADGGTQIPPALTEAYMRVLSLSASYRHMVLLTDGISEEGNSMDLARSAIGNKVTISTVGLGRDVNRGYLERIADLAGGKSYFLDDPQELEQILLRDVREHTGSTAR